MSVSTRMLIVEVVNAINADLAGGDRMNRQSSVWAWICPREAQEIYSQHLGDHES
jgi:hypothetical protein